MNPAKSTPQKTIFDNWQMKKTILTFINIKIQFGQKKNVVDVLGMK